MENKLLIFLKNNYKKINWSALAIIFILLLAILIFSLFDPVEKENNIREFTVPFQLDNQNSFSQNFSKIKTEAVELILSKILEQQKYNKICFKDRGSYISEQAFSDSLLLVEVSYNNKTEILSKNIPKCFKIDDKYNFQWNFTFSSPNEMTNSFLNVKEFRNLIIKPNILTYLQKNKLYEFYLFLFCLFYSGIFLWAFTRILQFIKKPLS